MNPAKNDKHWWKYLSVAFVLFALLAPVSGTAASLADEQPLWYSPGSFTGVGNNPSTFCDSEFTNLCFTGHLGGIDAYPINGIAGTTKWQWVAPGGADVALAPPVQLQLSTCPGGCEYLFAAASNGSVYRINAQDGSNAGAVDLRRSIAGVLVCPADSFKAAPTIQLYNRSNVAFQTAPSADGSLVYVITANGCGDHTGNRIYALHASDLSISWVLNADQSIKIDAGLSSCTLAYSTNTLYCGTDLQDGAARQDSIFAVNSIAGRYEWSINDGALLTSPLLSRNGQPLYVANKAGDVFALDGIGNRWVMAVAQPGTILTHLALDTRPDGPGAGRLLAVDSGGRLTLIQDLGDSAQIIWNSYLNSPDISAACPGADARAISAPVFLRGAGSFYVGADDGNIYECDPEADSCSTGGAAKLYLGDCIDPTNHIRHLSLDSSSANGAIDRLMGTSEEDVNGVPRVNRFAVPWRVSNFSADVALAMTGPAEAPPTPCSCYEDDLTVTNNGPNWATDVTVTDGLSNNAVLDPLPPGTGLGLGAPSQGTVDFFPDALVPRIVWSVGDMGPNTTATMSILVRYVPSTSVSILNVAVVSAGEPDPNLSNNSAGVTTVVNSTPCLVSKPALLSPSNGTIGTVRQVPFDWTDVACATRYGIQVRQDSTKGKIADQNQNLLTSQYTTKSLIPGKTYYWRVQACNAAGCSGWTTWWKFEVSSG